MAQIDVFKVAPKKGDLPYNPYVCIWLSQSSKDNHGRTILSPDLMTEKEVDESVDLLISQLEKVRKKAKRQLKK